MEIAGASDNGKDLLIIDDFKFRKAHQSKDGSMRWRCTVKTCKAKQSTAANTAVLIESQGTHNHVAQKHKLERQLVRSSCKRKAVEDLTVKPLKVIRAEIKTTNESTETLVYQDTTLIREAMYRRSVLPSLPISREQVHSTLNELSIRTNKGEDFLSINDPGKGIVIFTCETNLRFLCKILQIYVDGTFNKCTKYFVQMFTVHGLENGHYIPLAFCLLPSKQELCYYECFTHLKTKCLEYGLNFTPKTVVCDFEVAIHNAARKAWPTVCIIGCKFHLGQAWWRQIQKLGLSNHYKNKESEIGKWLSHIFGLSFLSPEEVGDCFAAELHAYMPNDDRVTKFADYLVDWYLEDCAPFPPKLWAEANSTTERSTCACESFHSRFNASFYASHPSLFQFYEALLQFQIDTYLKIRGCTIPAISRDGKVKKRTSLIKALLLKYSNHEISRKDFVQAIAYFGKAKKL